MATIAATACAKKQPEEAGTTADGSAASGTQASLDTIDDVRFFAWADLAVVPPCR